MPDRLKWNGHRFIYVHASDEEIQMAKTGERIRQIASEIDRLDPSRAPFFMGAECPTPGVYRGLFQDGVVVGEDACLRHALDVLAKVKK